MIQKRILAFLIDMTLLCVLSMIFKITTGIFVKDAYWATMISILPFALFFAKDSFTGRSFGRKAMKITVVNDADEIVAGPWKTFVRNLFTILWPIELLVLIGFNRRIGDMVTNTKVIEGEKHHKFSIIGVLITLMMWVIFGATMHLLLKYTAMVLIIR